MAGETQRASVGGQLIEEGIGRRMVGLARIPEDAGDAREQDKHVQVALRSRPVKVPGPQDLRPQHGLEALPALVAKGCIRQHADAVDHAGKRRQGAVHPRQHRIDRSRVGHVCDLDVDPEPAGSQRLDRILCRRIRGPAAVQNDRSRAPLREPFGQCAADAA